MFKEGLFNNKVALITGGGTGLGLEIGKKLLSYGAKLIIAGRRFDVLEATAKEISKSPGDVLPIKCDVRDIHEIEDLFDTGFKEFGKIDFLINNAAGNVLSPTERLSHNAFEIVIDIVLKGTINCSLVFGKKLIANNIPGSIINMSTNYASEGTGFMIPSACAKGGVEVLTKSLASEWAKYNIRVNAIAPGPIPTKGAWERISPDGLLSEDKIPFKRFGTYDELSDLASYLLSPSAEYITGQIICIDGGMTLSRGYSYLNDVPTEDWNKMLKKTKRL